MKQQRLFSALYLIAAVVGGYLCAPFMAELWVRILPTLRMGMMEEIPVFGGSRLMAVGIVALMYFAVRPASESFAGYVRRVACSLVGALVCFQLCFLVLLASDTLSWGDPYELSFFPTRAMEFWTHLVAMPFNLLLTPLGIGLGFHKDGGIQWTHGNLTDDPSEVPSQTAALAFHWALLALLVLVAVPIVWKMVSWIGKKMGIANSFTDDRQYRSVLRGWTAMMFLPIYFNGADLTTGNDAWSAYGSLPALGIIAGRGIAAAIVATPLFFLLVRKLRSLTTSPLESPQ